MINIAIYGYGNIGRATECGILKNPDMKLFGVFTRRNPESIKTLTGAKVYSAEDIEKYADDIDVLVICGGSATDLPDMTPKLAGVCNVIDSFDTHARIPEHYANVDSAAKGSGHTAMISCGWDPGLFSLARIYSSAVLPDGNTYTFWGRGVSQGHSDAIRHIEGVLDARQYTVPINEAVESVRKGENPELTVRQKHLRECYVVAADGADKAWIENQIKTMPNYFADYDTTVTFITEEEMTKDHSGLSHAGTVIRSGVTGIDNEHKHTVEYSLKLDSNPEFTASAILAYARAIYRMHERGINGCLTVMDVAPADLSILSGEELRKEML